LIEAEDEPPIVVGGTCPLGDGDVVMKFGRTAGKTVGKLNKYVRLRSACSVTAAARSG
jgi:hypothetical protein